MVGLPNGSQGPIDDMPQFPTAFPTREQFQDAGPEIGSGQKAVQEEAGPEERDDDPEHDGLRGGDAGQGGEVRQVRHVPPPGAPRDSPVPPP